MSWFARLMYRALVWKERKRAQLARRSPSGPQPGAAHLVTGERGEALAYWFLRQAGYRIIARNRRGHSHGELDLVAWDGPILAFIEVKTRTTEAAGRPEAAVSQSKQKQIAKAAMEYLKRLRRRSVNYRFDVVSVFWNAEAGYQVRLIKDAFKRQASC